VFFFFPDNFRADNDFEEDSMQLVRSPGKSIGLQFVYDAIALSLCNVTYAGNSNMRWVVSIQMSDAEAKKVIHEIETVPYGTFPNPQYDTNRTW